MDKKFIIAISIVFIVGIVVMLATYKAIKDKLENQLTDG